MPSWCLEDASIKARDNKYTFYKPGPDVIRRVAVGEIVKLIFKFETDDPEAPRAERMWVCVDTIGPGEVFAGRLTNEPRYIRDLKPGDLIHFTADHIINTPHDDHDNLVERYLPRCFVTQRVLKDGEKVGYLYREAPDDERDSGWRIMVGDESEAYMDDPKNIAYVSLGCVLNGDDSILSLLDAPPGSAFRRDSRGDGFIPDGDGVH